ncbi:hypothetical protein ACFL59_02020 [Planctomycetota bacterium]
MKLRTWTAAGLWAFALTAALSTSGCIKTLQNFTIYPDGSGKCEIKMTFLGMMAQMMKMGGEMGGMTGPDGQQMQDPKQAVKEALKGKVYWDTIEGKETEAETYTITGTGYFDNVTDLDLDDGSISFGPDGDGFKFSMTQKSKLGEGMPGLPPGLGGEGDVDPKSPQAEQMKTMAKAMLAGFEMKVNVRLPGEIMTIEGFGAHEGRAATFRLGEDQLHKMIDQDEKPPEVLTAVSGPAGEGLQAEWDGFKEKLAEVKKAQEEADKAEAEGEKKDEGADDTEGEAEEEGEF